MVICIGIQRFAFLAHLGQRGHLIRDRVGDQQDLVQIIVPETFKRVPGVWVLRSCNIRDTDIGRIIVGIVARGIIPFPRIGTCIDTDNAADLRGKTRYIIPFKEPGNRLGVFVVA